MFVFELHVSFSNQTYAIYIYLFCYHCSNKPVAESDFVIGKKQIIYVNGQAEELSSSNEEDEEEVEREKLEFSKDADWFMW